MGLKYSLSKLMSCNLLGEFRPPPPSNSSSLYHRYRTFDHFLLSMISAVKLTIIIRFSRSSYDLVYYYILRSQQHA